MITFRRIRRTYHIEIDGKDYTVHHEISGPTGWQPTGSEHWRVIARQGIHAGVRECDPNKPTFKRVVAAVQAEQNPQVSK